MAAKQHTKVKIPAARRPYTLWSITMLRYALAGVLIAVVGLTARGAFSYRAPTQHQPTAKLPASPVAYRLVSPLLAQARERGMLPHDRWFLRIRDGKTELVIVDRGVERVIQVRSKESR